MKKIIIIATFAVAILGSSFTASATEKDPGTNREPNLKVKIAFTSEFRQAADVQWSTTANSSVFLAKFKFNNEDLQAFFTEEGEFLGTTRQIVKSQLPVMVASQLDKQYADSHVVTIFEYSKPEGLEYYITLTTTKDTRIVKASPNGEISVYKKNVK